MNSAPFGDLFGHDELNKKNDWLEINSLKLLMAGAINSEFMTILAMSIIAAILYSYANPVYLFTWLGFSLALSLMRVYVSHQLATAKHLQNPDSLVRYFYRRIKPLILISCFFCGSTAYFIFGDLPQDYRFISLIVMMGVGLFNIHNLSPHRSTFIEYCNASMGTWIYFVALKASQNMGGPDFSRYLYLIPVFLLYWYLLMMTGKRLCKTHWRSLQSQYDNQHLIQSLKLETDLLLKEKVIALDAVAVKRRFISSAAHDIRQPVMAMTLYAEWLSNEPELGPKITPKILEASKAVNVLFDALFDLDRIESGQIQPELVSFDMAHTLQEIVNQFTPLARAKGLELRARIKPAKIYSDEVLFRRIIGNLLGNAIKYCNTGGVLLGVRRFQTGYHVEVWDTGVGIAPEHKSKVFKEFFKVRVSNGSDDGFGLGLPIVKRLASLMPEAELKMESVLNRGSVFKYYSPQALQ